ncbi:hypothetical protein JHK87_018547 [Glycine soja]|nr:hypothetical protein JHK87_018547 [Glycine soja]
MVVDEDHNGSNFNHIAFAFVDFSFNNFEGSILEELMSFTTLISLNLSHNALAGKIPSSMGNLKELQSLDLSSNNLDGENSSQLQSLTLLSYLNLSYNRLVGKIPITLEGARASLLIFIGFGLAKVCRTAAVSFQVLLGRVVCCDYVFSGPDSALKGACASLLIFTGFGLAKPCGLGALQGLTQNTICLTSSIETGLSNCVGAHRIDVTSASIARLCGRKLRVMMVGVDLILIHAVRGLHTLTSLVHWANQLTVPAIRSSARTGGSACPTRDSANCLADSTHKIKYACRRLMCTTDACTTG